MTSTGNTTDLVRNSTIDGINATIPTLSQEAGSTPDTLDNNTWGYKITTNTTTPSLVSSNFKPFSSNFILLSNESATNNDTASMSFASKINYNQPAGEYNLALNFAGVTNVVPPYMQDLDPSLCTTTPMTAIDKRDMNDYQIRKINGDCWMVQNLRFAGTKLDSTTSNVASTYTPSNPYIINSQDTPAGVWKDLTAGNNFDQARYHDSGNTDKGYWYNYAGASAGTITGESNSTETQYSICPAGWRLPNYDEINNMTTQIAVFNPVNGGWWGDGKNNGTERGSWWASRVGGSAQQRYLLDYNGSILRILNDGIRRSGNYIRCILNDTRTISNITYMQDMNSQIVANTPANATATMRDRRDGQDYTVGKLADGKIWMTSNLRLGLDESNPDTTTLEFTPDDTNVKEDRTITAYDLVTYGGSGKNCNGDGSGNGAGYTTPCIHSKNTTSGNNTIGIWYNYAAATAGTITGKSNFTEATEDICPNGWRLPSNDINKALVSAIGSSPASFGPVYGGNYYNGANTSLTTTWGMWWSNTAYDGRDRYGLYYNSNKLTINYSAGDGGRRNNGFYIRCIAKQLVWTGKK